jgi:co-chaperonin GroES (HSP10)
MLQPLKKQVVVKQIKVELSTASGIILSSDQSGNAEWVEIVSLGPDVHSDLRSGDRIIIDWKHARQVKYQNEVFYIIPEAHIMLVQE